MLESAISAGVYGMFGLFSRETSAPVTATVSTTGSLFHDRGTARAYPPVRAPVKRRAAGGAGRAASLAGLAVAVHRDAQRALRISGRRVHAERDHHRVGAERGHV